MRPRELLKKENSRQFLLFFISQTFVAAGGFLQLIAVAALMVEVTNSGVITGFSIVCAPLPGVLLSLFAGGIGDRLPVKQVLILIDIVRGLMTGLFLLCHDAVSIFALTLLLNSFDVLYNPSRNKLLAVLLPKGQLLTGNSVLSGGYGAVSIAVPVLAGVLVGRFGVGVVFLLNALGYLLSALSLSGIRPPFGNLRFSDTAEGPYEGSIHQISQGLRYCFSVSKLKKAVFTSAFIDFCTISINIAFYAFAFDTLRVSSASWGVMLSVIYGMSLVSMLLILLFKKQFGKRQLTIVYLLLTVVSAVWFCYGLAGKLPTVLICEVFEGLSLSLCGTLLLTYLLQNAKNEYTARVMGIRDLFSNLSKLAGVVYTYLFMRFFKPKMVFSVTSALMMLFAVSRLLLRGEAARKKKARA